jgi:hypothetical protein
MTVHEGLAELKTLDKRIADKRSKDLYIYSNKHMNAKIDGMTVEEFSKGLKANMQSIEDLIARRAAIKRAITLSNAETNITLTDVDGKSVTMSVAEAIEYKAVGIQYLEELLNTISSQYTRIVRDMRARNDNLSNDADRMIAATYGSKDNTSADVIASERERYIANNTIDLIDPNKIETKMEQLRNKIDFFKTRVDAALSTSNAITVITFEC